jgi:hypothetical protein
MIIIRIFLKKILWRPTKDHDHQQNDNYATSINQHDMQHASLYQRYNYIHYYIQMCTFERHEEKAKHCVILLLCTGWRPDVEFFFWLVSEWLSMSVHDLIISQHSIN